MSTVPYVQRVAKPSGWWGMVVFIATEATLFGTLIGSYYDLRFRTPHWPPVGVPDPIKGEALVCFCVLRKDANGDVTLAAELKQNVARDLGKALAPRDVFFVADIPKTRNAKVMRRVMRAAYIGEKLGDTSALENPASLEEIKHLASEVRLPA